MAFIPFLNGVKVTVIFELNGVEIINRHFFINSSAQLPDATDILALCNMVYQAYVDNWLPAVAQELVLTNVEGRGTTTQTEPYSATTLPLPVAGSVVISQAMSNQVALVVSLRTLVTGRSARGRTYLAGFAEDTVAANQVIAGLQTAALDTLTDIGVNATPLGYQHRIVSYFTNGAPRVQATSRGVVNRIVNSRVDTQRRRLPT